MARIPFLDLASVEAPLRSEMRNAIDEVVRSCTYISGPAVETFEAEWAAYCGSRHAIGVGNGTDAIELSLRALGIGPGDEVIVPGNTFIATAEAVVACGATPFFADVDPSTLLVTPATLAHAIRPRTAAMIVVHLYGQPADMTGIAALARSAGVALLEDCAQAHAARWQGQHVGTFGQAGCFSFYPTKNLGAVGDAGAIVTNDSCLEEKVRRLADHGRVPKEKFGHKGFGRNSRLDSLQAAVLSVKLPHLDAWTQQRRRAMDLYRSLLQATDEVRTTSQPPGGEISAHLAVVQVAYRDDVRRHLYEHDIDSSIHYPDPCHVLPGYERFPRSGLAVCEESAPRLLSLPLYPGISDDDVRSVVRGLMNATADMHRAKGREC